MKANLEREATEMQGMTADHEDSKYAWDLPTHHLEDEKKWSSQFNKKFEDFRKKLLMESESVHVNICYETCHLGIADEHKLHG